MGEQDSRDQPGFTRASDLIADFHERHEAWRRQGENLERMRADARAAAAVEAAAILTSARGDLRRIVVDARRALLALTEQLQAIAQQPGNHADQEPQDDVPHSVLQARRDLARLLTDMRPELDELAVQTRQFDEPSAAQPVVAEPPVVPAVDINDVEHDAALAAIAPLFRKELVVDRAAPVPAAPVAESPQPGSRFALRGKAMLIAIVGLTIVGGGGWWLTDTLTSDNLARTVASIPPAPRDKPSRLINQVLTIDATLIELPSAAPAEQSTGTASPTAPAGGTDASR